MPFFRIFVNMNYLKKIKLLGFKKVEPFVIVNKNYRYDNIIMPYNSYLVVKDNKLKSKTKDIYELVFPRKMDKHQYYNLKTSDINLYLIINRMEYNIVIIDTNGEIEKHLYLKLDPGFWQKILNLIPPNLKREIILDVIL